MLTKTCRPMLSRRLLHSYFIAEVELHEFLDLVKADCVYFSNFNIFTVFSVSRPRLCLPACGKHQTSRPVIDIGGAGWRGWMYDVLSWYDGIIHWSWRAGELESRSTTWCLLSLPGGTQARQSGSAHTSHLSPHIFHLGSARCLY